MKNTTCSRFLFPVLSALVYSLVPKILGKDKQECAMEINRITRFVQHQLHRMPQYLAIPMMILIVIFDWAGLFRTGKRFHCQMPQQRESHIAQWKQSRLGICRDFIQFHETFVTFACYPYLENN